MWLCLEIGVHEYNKRFVDVSSSGFQFSYQQFECQIHCGLPCHANHIKASMNNESNSEF